MRCTNENPIKMLDESGNRCACGFSAFGKFYCTLRDLLLLLLSPSPSSSPWLPLSSSTFSFYIFNFIAVVFPLFVCRSTQTIAEKNSLFIDPFDHSVCFDRSYLVILAIFKMHRHLNQSYFIQKIGHSSIHFCAIYRSKFQNLYLTSKNWLLVLYGRLNFCVPNLTNFNCLNGIDKLTIWSSFQFKILMLSEERKNIVLCWRISGCE